MDSYVLGKQPGLLSVSRGTRLLRLLTEIMLLSGTILHKCKYGYSPNTDTVHQRRRGRRSSAFGTVHAEAGSGKGTIKM